MPNIVFFARTAVDGNGVLGAFLALNFSASTGVHGHSRLRTISPEVRYIVKDCAPSGSTGANV